MPDLDQRVRLAAFNWLDERSGDPREAGDGDNGVSKTLAAFPREWVIPASFRANCEGC